MNIAKLDWFWRSGSSYTSEYQAVLDRATALGYTAPSAGQKTKQDTLIAALKTATIWDDLDWLYITLNDVSLNFGRINWISPSSYALTGSPTFTSNQGVKSNGSTYLDTTWDFGNATKMSQNDSSYFVWVFTDGNDGKCAIGSIKSGTDRTVQLITRDASNRCGYAGINTATGIVGAGSSLTSDNGLHLIARTDANTMVHYKNTSQTATGASTSISPVANDVYLLARNFNGTADTHFLRDCSVFGAGKNLVPKITSLYNAINTYVSNP